MKRVLIACLFFMFPGAANVLMAQGVFEQNKPITKKDTTVTVYLGNSTISNGPIQKHIFDSLMKQGLTIREAVPYSFSDFMFTYAERNLYEDSLGQLVVVPDYLTEYCNGNTLTSSISGSLYNRTKVGDTIYIDGIHLVKPGGGSMRGKAMKLFIIK